MTTVINNPGEGGGSAAGWVVAVVVIVILVVVFFIYGLPALQGTPANNTGGAQINVQIPSGSNSNQ